MQLGSKLHTTNYLHVYIQSQSECDENLGLWFFKACALSNSLRMHAQAPIEARGLKL